MPTTRGNGPSYRDSALVEAEALRERDAALEMARHYRRESLRARVVAVLLVTVSAVALCAEIWLKDRETSRAILAEKQLADIKATVTLRPLFRPMEIQDLPLRAIGHGCTIAMRAPAALGGVTHGKIVVWDNQGTVRDAFAATNLTTGAGVALTDARTGEEAAICSLGLVTVDCDDGVRVGDLVGTSGLAAGSAQSTRLPAPGSIIGRVVEERGVSAAGKCRVDVGLR